MGVYLRAGYATQGPCPDGFHIPITDDADTIRSIYFTLDDICDEINGEMLREHAGRSGVEELFLIPPLGYVNYDWGDAKWEYRGSYGRTWLAEYPGCTNPLPDDCEGTALRRSYPGADNNDAICTRTGMPIRPFKDISVPPEDSWSALVDMTNDVRDYYRQEYEDPTRDGLDYLAGIFWKEDLGLVTISDGFNYITIADKNLGAKAVRLGGDSKLTDAYYGDIFQRGNNFAFTSDENGQLGYWEEAIDASGYGPGNYYSSSTYVGRVEDPVEACEWDSSHNTNLRGGDVGNVPVQKELKNAYIGIPNPTSIVLDKSSITLTTIGQTEQLTATIEPTVSDKTITWSSDDTTVATVSTTGLVTCVTPGTCTITATTVNGLTASCSVIQSRLPSAYQEVEYIQSSGTQYINTGWYPSSNYCKVVMDGTVYSGNSSWSVFFGMTNGENAYSLHTNHSTWYFNLGRSININTNISFSNGTDGTFTFDANNGSISVDIAGSTYTGSYSGSVSQSTRPFYIFAFDENGSITWKATMRVNSFKIYSDANTIERDFVPCYRKADSVIGLYDIVNNQFYTNQGSGTFTKGGNV